jgi:diguanylate cyclase (GGDEF)-like protein
MDLDRFKDVNDTLGHHVGDQLLREISRLLSKVIEGKGIVARLGGDEFAALLTEVADEEEALDLGRSVLAAVERPIRLHDLNLEVGASIGVALFPTHGEDSTALLQRADVAMYSAKINHTGVEPYSAERDDSNPRRLALAGELRVAVEASQLSVHYQPKADLRTGRITGVEALVRWAHPRLGFMSSDEFVPIAEHTGLMRPLTLSVLEQTLAQCRSWRGTGIRLDVAVNLSARSLMDPHLPDDVGDLLRRAGVTPECLTLELTEATVMADPPRTIGVLSRLSAMGVNLAIDDFGTGYSSLSYLKRLPVDEVKIDKSLVLNMRTDENDAVIVRSTVELARNLGLRVTAEGVEDGRNWSSLRALGCDMAQGYYLSRPVSAPKLTALLGQFGLDVRNWIDERPDEPSLELLPAAG